MLAMVRRLAAGGEVGVQLDTSRAVALIGTSLASVKHLGKLAWVLRNTTEKGGIRRVALRIMD